MAKQVEGVYEKVLKCAKKEFLEKGYNDASLRNIALSAETSTSSIYTRFSDKRGLFEALVLPVIEDLKKWFWQEQENFHNFENNKQKEEIFDYSKDRIKCFVDYIYDNFEVFKLIITCSKGTEFSDFVHDIVEIDVEYTIKYIEATNSDAITSNRASQELLHMLSSAFYSGIFEAVTHNMSRESAYTYVNQIRVFFQAGFKEILS